MYSIMHRAQLNLEEWQMEALRTRAEGEGRSVSDLVREAVAEYLAEPQAGKGRTIPWAGAVDDPAMTPAARLEEALEETWADDLHRDRG